MIPNFKLCKLIRNCLLRIVSEIRSISAFKLSVNIKIFVKLSVSIICLLCVYYTSITSSF